MGRRKTGATPTNPPKAQKKMVIDMTKAELAKSYITPGFKTGKYMTEKDRPRKKNWKREYEKGRRESDFNNNTDSFLLAEKCALSHAPQRTLDFSLCRKLRSSETRL